MSEAISIPSLDPWFPPERAATPAPKPLRAIGLIGVEAAGVEIAHWCATRGLGVILHHEEPAVLTQAVGMIRDLFQAAENRSEITHAAAHKALGGIGITTSVEDLEFCDAVIDTEAEPVAAKRTRYVELARRVPPETILACAVPDFALEELFVDTAEPSRVLGLSFFAPVYSSPSINIAIGSKTGRVAALRTVNFVAALGKTPVLHGPVRSAG